MKKAYSTITTICICLSIGVPRTLLAQEIIPLYSSPPGNKKAPDQERTVTTEAISRVSKVSVPTLTMYKAPAGSAKTASVIICPGGGYSILAINHEGTDVAKVFQEWGITAFVLKYRLPDDSIMDNKEMAPLQDAQRAIQLVRQNADKWGIDADRIGIMGFSAGGHLASTVSTHFTNPVTDNPSSISIRPDFSILIYPVISFTDSLTHMGSRNRLLGKVPAAEKIIHYSNELQVSSQTPPAFMVHAGDDKSVKPSNSIAYYQALLKNGVSAELHLYQNGGHGFGMNNKTTTDRWMDRLRNWLQSNKLL
jgi:acetyl esterase/lipase